MTIGHRVIETKRNWGKCNVGKEPSGGARDSPFCKFELPFDLGWRMD